MIERVLADQQRREVVIGDRLQRPAASLQRVGEAQAAVPGVGVEVDDQQKDVVEPPAPVAPRAAP